MLTAVTSVSQVVTTHLVLIAAVWGAIAATVAKLIRQDGLPSWVNQAITNVSIVVTAVLTAWVQAPPNNLTWHLISVALFGAVAGAIANHELILDNTPLGDILQTFVTLFNTKPAAAVAKVGDSAAAIPASSPPVDPAPAAAPLVVDVPPAAPEAAPPVVAVPDAPVATAAPVLADAPAVAPTDVPAAPAAPSTPTA
jgi:hypothetical protein